MSKKIDENILTEEETNVVRKAVNAIFSAVSNRRMKALEKVLMKDADFKASIERLEKARDEMETKLQKTVYKRKGHADFEDWYAKNITPLSK